MMEGAPPVLNDSDQIGDVMEQGNAHWAIHLAVEYPVPAIIPEMIAIGFAFIDNLVVIGIAMRDPVGYE